jgi:hypothetical protein
MRRERQEFFCTSARTGTSGASAYMRARVHKNGARVTYKALCGVRRATYSKKGRYFFGRTKKENGTGLKTDRLYKRIRAQPEHFFFGDRSSRVMLGSYLLCSFHWLSPSFTHTFCFVCLDCLRQTVSCPCNSRIPPRSTPRPFALFHALSPFHPLSLSPSFTLTFSHLLLSPFHSFICSLFYK